MIDKSGINVGPSNVEWISNGALLAWLIDPYERTVTIYSPDHPTRAEMGLEVAGTSPMESFVLDLRKYRSVTDRARIDLRMIKKNEYHGAN